MNAVGNALSLARIYGAYVRRREKCSYLPIFIGVETSGLCNLRCVMCPHGLEETRQRRGLMNFQTYCRVIDEARGFVQDADLFGGGEPLMHPRIFDMIAYARQAGIRTRLHTNATLLTPERGRLLLESGLDYLSFSFDGYTKDRYESIRVGADYERSLQNITDFLGQKQQLGGRRPYTVLQSIEDTSERLGPDAQAAKDDLRRRLAGLPLDEFRVIPLHNYGGKVPGSRGQEGRYSPCTFPYYAIYVLWDGTIVPCCVDWWGELGLGNICNTSLVDAWGSDGMRNLRRLLGTRRYKEVPLCSACDRLWRTRRLGIPQRSTQVVRQFIIQHVLGY